jgi:hypothetical protein
MHTQQVARTGHVHLEQPVHHGLVLAQAQRIDDEAALARKGDPAAGMSGGDRGQTLLRF